MEWALGVNLWVGVWGGHTKELQISQAQIKRTKKKKMKKRKNALKTIRKEEKKKTYKNQKRKKEKKMKLSVSMPRVGVGWDLPLGAI